MKRALKTLKIIEVRIRRLTPINSIRKGVCVE